MTYEYKNEVVAKAYATIKLLLKKYPALADIKNKDGMGPGNLKFAGKEVHDLIKPYKSTFLKKNPNTEKNKRGGLRKTRNKRKNRR
jgi:hypothetical protein